MYVWIARDRTDVYTISNLNPFWTNFCPASLAYCIPLEVNLTSVQPVNRFCKFQIDSPWRMNTTWYLSDTLLLKCLVIENISYLYIKQIVHYLNKKICHHVKNLLNHLQRARFFQPDNVSLHNKLNSSNRLLIYLIRTVVAL